MKIKENPQEYSIKELEKLIPQLAEAYFNDQPLVEDDIYDLLVETLRTKDPKNKILSKVGAPVKNQKVKLPFRMSGIDTKKNLKEINSWKKKFSSPYIISSKLDGISGLIILKPASHGEKVGEIEIFTRGDHEYGKDHSNLALHMSSDVLFDNVKNIKKLKEKIYVRGEFVMRKEVYEKYYKELTEIKGEKEKFKFSKNRSCVNSIFVSKNPDIDLLNNIEFVAHEKIDKEYKSFSEQFKELKNLGFKVVDHKIIEDFTFKNLEEWFKEMKKKSLYEMDGIVISKDNPEKRYSKDKPKYSFAFKIDKGYPAIVEDVIWEASKYGVLVPVVKIHPIKIDGDNITYSSGFNAKYIQDNEIGKGTEIIITKSGDVIPYIMSITNPTGAKLPKRSLWEWNETKVDIILKDKDIPTVNIKRILHFFRTLDIAYINDGTIKKLYENNYTSISSIYHMKVENFMDIEGIKEKSANKFYDSIHSTLDKEIELAKLMHSSLAFGQGFGEKMFQIIIDQYGKKWDKIILEDLLILDGFSDITSNGYLNGIDEFKKFLKRNSFLNWKITKHVKEIKEGQNASSHAKLHIVFSGFRDKKLKEELENIGVTVENNITKKTNILLVKDLDSSSSKVEKAKEKGIKVIHVDEIENYL